MIAAGVIGGLYILCAVILSVGVREKRGEAGDMLGILQTCGNAVAPARSSPELLAPRLWVKPQRRGADRAEV